MKPSTAESGPVVTSVASKQFSRQFSEQAVPRLKPWGLGFRVQGLGFRVQGLGFLAGHEPPFEPKTQSPYSPRFKVKFGVQGVGD